MTDTAPSPRRARRVLDTGTSYMVVGTLIAATAAYVFQLVAGRALGPEEFAPITVLWTLQFLVFTTVLMPMEQMTIRRLNESDPTAAPWKLHVRVIALTAVGSVVFAWITMGELLADDGAFLLIVAPLIIGYGIFGLGRGYLAGRHRFREYGLATLAESVLRLALALVVLAAGAGAVGIGWTLVAGSITVLAWRPFRRDGVTTPPGAVEPGTTARLTTFITANAASQTIVASGPLLVAGLGAPRAEVSVFFETFLLFRAPLTVAYSLVARILPPFTRLITEGRVAEVKRWALRMGAAGVLLGAGGYALGRLLGPIGVETLLGEEFRPTASLAGYAGGGAAIATVALFAQQILIAMRSMGRLAAAWLSGLAVSAIVVALASGSPSLRVGVAFLTGEAVALALIVIAIVSAPDRPPDEAQRAP